MFYYKNMYFLYFMIMGTIIVISSSSWFMSWVGLEMNLLSFIPIMMSNNSLEDSECSIKYFLVQAIGSIVLLFGILLSFLSSKNFMIMNESIYSIIIFVSLGMKMGVPPFHYWFPEVAISLNWFSNILLLIWQKLGPFILMNYVIFNLNFKIVFLFVVLSMFIGGLGGLNQTSLKKIMVFSSINHMGWMIMAMLISLNVWFIYYLVYSCLSFGMMSIFWMMNLNYFQDLVNFKFGVMQKVMLFLNLLSLGGLPPFLGFYPKWMIIESLAFSNLWFIMFLMVVLTMISLYFYMRLAFMAFTILSELSLTNFYYKQFQWETISIMMSMITLVNFLGLLFLMSL